MPSSYPELQNPSVRRNQRPHPCRWPFPPSDTTVFINGVEVARLQPSSNRGTAADGSVHAIAVTSLLAGVNVIAVTVAPTAAAPTDTSTRPPQCCIAELMLWSAIAAEDQPTLATTTEAAGSVGHRDLALTTPAKSPSTTRTSTKSVSWSRSPARTKTVPRTPLKSRSGSRTPVKSATAAKTPPLTRSTSPSPAPPSRSRTPSRAPLATGSTVVLQRNAVWSYLATGAAAPGDWAAPGFDDSAWPSGRGKVNRQPDTARLIHRHTHARTLAQIHTHTHTDTQTRRCTRNMQGERDIQTITCTVDRQTQIRAGTLTRTRIRAHTHHGFMQC